MAETVISEAPAESTGADTQAQGPMSMEDLAASFVDQVEQDQEATTDEAKAEVTESSEDAEASVEEDVLSQSISEEEDEDTEEEAEESDEEDESEEPPKAVGKLLKQVNKLTARAKSAEETAEALKAEIQNLKTQGSSQPAKQPELENIQSYEDLNKLRQEAQAAKKFALQNIGKSYVEVDGKEYSDDDIRNILTQADEYLTEKIPARANYLQQKAQWQQDTIATHSWLNEDSELAETRQELFSNLKSQYSHILNNLPNGDFVAATLVRGIEAIKADQKASTAPKKKAVKPKAPPPTDGGNVSPPVENAATRKQKQKESIKRKGPLSANDLAAYLSD
jgi:hypothetical protein